MTVRPIVVGDTETTGLDPLTDQIWEVSIVRIEYNAEGHETVSRRTFQVEHDTELARSLPASFFADYSARFDPATAVSKEQARAQLGEIFRDAPTLVGAVPSFDAAFLEKLLGARPWHHRLRCVETLTAGKLGRDPGGLNDCLVALGLDPNVGAHTAEGDADAAYRIWRHILG